MVSQRIAQAASFALAFLQQYLARQVAVGRLRPHDTEASARSFMGLVMVYLLHQELMPSLTPPLPEIDHYIEEALRIFLEGLQVK